MSARFDQLAERRRALRAHCAVQRNELAVVGREIEDRLGDIDRRIAAVRNLLRHPAVLVAGIAAIVLIGPQRLLRWASRGAMLYTAGKRLRGP